MIGVSGSNAFPPYRIIWVAGCSCLHCRGNGSSMPYVGASPHSPHGIYLVVVLISCCFMKLGIAMEGLVSHLVSVGNSLDILAI